MCNQIKRNVLLNPGPATTTDTVKYAMVVPDICPREKEFCKIMDQIRNKLVKVVNGNTQQHTAIIFASSGTGGVEACISSVLPVDKKILIISNGAYGKRMIEMAEAYYSQDQIIKHDLPFGTYPDLTKIEKIIQKNLDISHIGVIHHETTSGMLNPVKKLARIAHKYDIELIVDAMSSYAGMQIDIDKDGFDYIISSSNKCIQGMAGISFVITRKKNINEIKNNQKKNLYFNLWEQYSYFEKTGQMRFTPPVQILYALNQALDEFFVETGEIRYKRYSESWETLIDGLNKLNFEFLLPLKYQSKILTTILEPKDSNYNFDEMHDYLYENGFTIYPGKIGELNTFRISNLGAIDKNDILKFLELLKNYLDLKKITLK